jgi:hypothetical protein
MANLVSVCLHAGKRASVSFPAEAISPGPYVRRWDNEFLLSFGATHQLSRPTLSQYPDPCDPPLDPYDRTALSKL